MSSHHDSEGKPNGDSNILSLTPNSSRKYDLNVHADRKRFVQEVVVYFTTWHKKLRELKPQIVIVQGLFAQHVRGSVTLCGCRSFREFCEKKLNVKQQTVYAMLGGYSEKAKKKRQVRERKGTDGALPMERQKAAVMALDAVNRFRTAKTTEDKDAAWREYEQIADSGVTLKSSLAGDDQPDYQRLLRDVLLAALQLHAALSNIVKAGILEEDSALLMATMAALDAGKMLAAVRRRLNIDQPTVQ